MTIFVLSDLALSVFVFVYQVDTLEKAVQKVCRIFLKLWSFVKGTNTLS